MRVNREDLIDVTAFVDPASGRMPTRTALKSTMSRSANVVVGQDAQGHIFVLHAWAARIPTTSHTDRIFKLSADWRPRVIGIDASAMQSLYADALLLEAKHRVHRLPLQPIKMPPNVDKDSRIRAVLQPVISQGRLFVRADQRDLYAELEAFPGSPSKDMVDALAEAIVLLRRIAPSSTGYKDREAHLEYLTATGAPRWYIDQVRAS